jgi:AraC family transcriptional regulator
MPTQASDSSRRIRSIIDDELRPGVGVLLFSSWESGWPGFLFERRKVVEVGDATRLVCPVPRAVLIASGTLTIAYRAGFAPRRVIAASGSILIWPGDYEVQSLSWTGDCELLEVEIDLAMLQELTGSSARLSVARLTPQLAIHNRQIAALIRGMEAEARGGCLAGSLYGESLSLALAAYVAGRYSTGTRAGESRAGRLSPRQVSMVREHIRANLGSRLSLSELAGVVQLSPHYFSQVFRNSVGATPHEYVLGERIRGAATLLTNSDTPVVQVACMLGFASQSHFADVFHRATAMTPKQYRDARRHSAPRLSFTSPEVRRPA